MPNPWDPFPMPTRGDLSDGKTYEGVGRVVALWESIEFDLSRLYSTFVSDPDGEAIGAYGKGGRIFRERLDGLRGVAQRYFQEKPNQELEGEFDLLCTEAEGFAGRRNEVAHGIVFAINKLAFFADRFDLSDGKKQFLLIPPLFAIRNHKDGLPAWAYSFAEMWELMARLVDLSFKIDGYRRRLLGLPPRHPAP